MFTLLKRKRQQSDDLLWAMPGGNEKEEAQTSNSPRSGRHSYLPLLFLVCCHVSGAMKVVIPHVSVSMSVCGETWKRRGDFNPQLFTPKVRLRRWERNLASPVCVWVCELAIENEWVQCCSWTEKSMLHMKRLRGLGLRVHVNKAIGFLNTPKLAFPRFGRASEVTCVVKA